jgi:hypothetical protein
MENAGGPVKAACADREDRISPCRMTAQTDREKRLAEALRQNLRRRKEQAREKDAPEREEKDD